MYHKQWTTRDTLCESRGHPRHHPQGQWWSRQTVARRKAQSVEVVHDLVVPVPHRRLSLICIKYARVKINMFLKHVWYQPQTKRYTNYMHEKHIKILNVGYVVSIISTTVPARAHAKIKAKPNKGKYQSKSQLLHKERRLARYITNVAMRISGE